MLQPNFTSSESANAQGWEELGRGVPTITALARLCGQVISTGTEPTREIELLSNEALAILCLSRNRGVIQLRMDKNAFNSVDRFLAVSIEVDDDRRRELRDNSQPRKSMLFLDGFRQLCQYGLVLHHQFAEFSLTAAGFELAEQIDPSELKSLLEFGEESGI